MLGAWDSMNDLLAIQVVFQHLRIGAFESMGEGWAVAQAGLGDLFALLRAKRTTFFDGPRAMLGCEPNRDLQKFFRRVGASVCKPGGSEDRGRHP